MSALQGKDVSMILGVLSVLAVRRAGPPWAVSTVCVSMVRCGDEVGSVGAWYG